MRYKPIIFSVVIVLSVTLFSCSPLRHVQKKEQKQQVTVDKSISEMVKTEIERQISSMSQTIVEFYPPMSVYSIDTLTTLNTENSNSEPTAEQKQKNSVVYVDSVDPQHTNNSKKPPKISIKQPIKSITTTQINTATDKITQKDSVSVSDIVHTVDTDYTENSKEQPSNFVSSIKWIAILLGVILLIILIIKFR